MSDDLATAVRMDGAADIDELLSGLGNSGPKSVRGRDEPIAVWTL